MFGSTERLIDKCRLLGKDSPSLSEDNISKQLAKIIVGQKILDDDAFEMGRKAYNEGVKSSEARPEEG